MFRLLKFQKKKCEKILSPKKELITPASNVLPQDGKLFKIILRVKPSIREVPDMIFPPKQSLSKTEKQIS